MTSPSHGSGYYAAGPKKSSPHFLVVLAVLLAAGVLAAVLFGGGSEPEPAPADDPAVAPAAAVPEEEPERPLVRIGESGRDDELEELRAENARLRKDLQRLEDVLSGADVDAEVRELEAENARLETEVELLRAEVARHRMGLERAVAELNAGRRPARKSRPAEERTDDHRSSWVFPRDPYAVVNAGRVDVEGTVHNANGESMKGYVKLTVFENGRQLMEERVGPITIPGRTVEDYRHTISDPRIQHGPSYEVRATWVPQ